MFLSHLVGYHFPKLLILKSTKVHLRSKTGASEIDLLCVVLFFTYKDSILSAQKKESEDKMGERRRCPTTTGRAVVCQSVEGPRNGGFVVRHKFCSQLG